MINKKKYLVTGGLGFIGSHLIDSIISNNDKVICIDDLSSGFKRNLTKNNSIKLLIKDLKEIEKNDIDPDIDGIFHLAAQTSVPISIDNFYESSKNNLLGMLNIWDFAVKKNLV